MISPGAAPAYAEDAERTFRALSARGVTTLVALAGGRIVGGYYERLGASRSLGFRLTREALGLGETETG